MKKIFKYIFFAGCSGCLAQTPGVLSTDQNENAATPVSETETPSEVSANNSNSLAFFQDLDKIYYL